MSVLSEFSLVQINGPNNSIYSLFYGKNLVGRHKNAEVKITSKYASKKHAEILISETNEIALVNSSKYGTCINGTRTQTWRNLKVNDRISFGCTKQFYQLYQLYRNGSDTEMNEEVDWDADTDLDDPIESTSMSSRSETAAERTKKEELDSDAESVDFKTVTEVRVETPPAPQMVDLTESHPDVTGQETALFEIVVEPEKPMIQPRIDQSQNGGNVPLPKSPDVEMKMENIFGSPQDVMCPDENRYADTPALEQDLTGSQLELPTVIHANQPQSYSQSPSLTLQFDPENFSTLHPRKGNAVNVGHPNQEEQEEIRSKCSEQGSDFETAERQHFRNSVSIQQHFDQFVQGADESGDRRNPHSSEAREVNASFKCKYCERSFPTNKGLNYHKLRKHEDQLLDSEKFRCSRCNAILTSIKSRKSHFRRVHEKHLKWKKG